MPMVEFPFWMPFTYHSTLVSWGPVTTALKVIVLPPATVALVGDMVTVVFWLPPPLPGACAIHPTQASRAHTAMDHNKMAGRNFPKGPSDEEKGIRNVGGRKREVYSVQPMLSRAVPPVKCDPAVAMPA